MSKYLITGGAGFIGSHLSQALLAQGDEVVILDNLLTGKMDNVPAKAHFVKADVLNPSSIEEIIPEVDGCIHLAAIVSVIESKIHWQETHQVNMVGTINVLNAICQHSAKRRIPLLLASSCAVYGENNHLPLKEKELTRPISAYGADKLCSEIHAYVANAQYQIPIFCFRIFNTYGPRQDPNSPYAGVISLFMNHMMSNEPIQIYGDGEQTRDFVYVADVVQYFLKALQYENENIHVCNICRGESISINHLAKEVARITQCKPQISYQDVRQGDVYHSLGSNQLITSILDYHPKYTLQQGLLDYYKYLTN